MDRDTLKQIVQDQNTVLAAFAVTWLSEPVQGELTGWQVFAAQLESAAKQGALGVMLAPEHLPQLAGRAAGKGREGVAITAALADWARRANFKVLANPQQRGVYAIQW